MKTESSSRHRSSSGFCGLRIRCGARRARKRRVADLRGDWGTRAMRRSNQNHRGQLRQAGNRVAFQD